MKSNAKSNAIIIGLIAGLGFSGYGFAKGSGISDVSTVNVVVDKKGSDYKVPVNFPASASIITDKQLRKNGYTDPMRVLEQVPGVQLRGEDGFGLRMNIGIRGSGSERSGNITLMEDGVLLTPAPYSYSESYFTPAMGRVHAVEVRKGGASIKYGPRTTAGAINFITVPIPEAGEVVGRAEYSNGSYATQNLITTVGAGRKNYGFIANFNRYSSDGFKNLTTGKDTGFATGDAMLKFRVNSDEGATHYNKVELKVGLNDHKSNETYVGLTKGDYIATPYGRYIGSEADKMNAKQSQFQLRHVYNYLDKFKLNTVMYRNKFQRDWFRVSKVNGKDLDAIFFNNDTASLGFLTGASTANNAITLVDARRKFYSTGVQSVSETNFSTGNLKHKLEAGLRVHGDSMDRFQDKYGYSVKNGALVQDSSSGPGSDSNYVVSAMAYSGFVTDEVTWGNWLFMPGVRYEAIELNTQTYSKTDPSRVNGEKFGRKINAVIPAFSASYKINDGNAVFAGVHEGFAPPQPSSDKTYAAQSEHSVNYEFGFRGDSGVFRYQAAGFLNRYSNLLLNDSAGSGGAELGKSYNGGRADVKGIELEGGYVFTTDALPFKMPVSVNYTYTDAKFKNSFTSSFAEWGGTITNGDKIPYVSPHQGSITGGLEAASWLVNLKGTYFHKMLARPGYNYSSEAFTTDSYFVVDGSAEYEIARKSRMFVRVLNLTNQQYIISRAPAGIRPGAPRMILVGARLEI